VSVEKLTRLYGEDVAFVAGEPAAAGLAGFAEQLSVAADRLERAGLDDGDASMAAVYLADAAEAESDAERRALIKRAAELLRGFDEALSDYRLSA